MQLFLVFLLSVFQLADSFLLDKCDYIWFLFEECRVSAVVFGDSISDMGVANYNQECFYCLFFTSNGLPVDASQSTMPFTEYSFTSGEVHTTNLRASGLSSTKGGAWSRQLEDQAYTQVDSFAYGRARVIDDVIQPCGPGCSFVVPSFATQINNFIASGISPDIIYVEFTGNDLLAFYLANPTAGEPEIITFIQTLIGAYTQNIATLRQHVGADVEIVIFNQPTIPTPFGAAVPDLGQIGIYLNTQINNYLNVLVGGFDNVRVFDFDKVTKEIFQLAGEFGLETQVGYGKATSLCNPLSCEEQHINCDLSDPECVPENYFFVDDVHPNALVHQWIAQGVYEDSSHLFKPCLGPADCRNDQF